MHVGEELRLVDEQRRIPLPEELSVGARLRGHADLGPTRNGRGAYATGRGGRGTDCVPASVDVAY